MNHKNESFKERRRGPNLFGGFSSWNMTHIIWVIHYDFLWVINMTHFVWLNNNWDEFCMWVMFMTHLKDSMKSEFVDRIFLIFAWALNSNFKNFDFTGSKIKFPIEWYLYLVYFISRIGNIADVLKIEQTQWL